MEFGVFDHIDSGGGTPGADYAHRLALAEMYDRLGFYAYHQAEHHATPLGAAPSPGIFLAALAQRTRRLRFGPLVYTLPLYHPLRLIEEICMLDHLSGGRLEMGVGKGISPHEVRFYGLDPAQVQPMFIEALALIRGALAATGQEFSFTGKYYKLDAVPMTMGSVQQPHPPLWVGTSHAEGVPWAAANRVNLVANLPAARVRAIADRYRVEWAELREDPAEMPKVGVSRHIVIAETDAEALAVARRAYKCWAASFYQLWDARGGRPPNAIVPPEFDDMMARGQAIAGSPATVRSFLAKDIAAGGVTYLLCRFAFGDQTQAETMRSVELFGREVMGDFAPVSLAAE
jgi:alkanesulfonate monooxygenase SsuD/methylene tetrahydromethanopterin reductase-like flavin-dependent oxidoreductase (luciferase family)